MLERMPVLAPGSTEPKEPLKLSEEVPGFDEPGRPTVLPLLLFCVGMAIIFWLLHRGHVADIWLEDLPVYRHALYNWLTGRNPYNNDLAPLYFLYPPAFLIMAGIAWHVVPLHWGSWLYGALHVVATCALPLVLARFYFRRAWLGPLFALLLFFASPRFTGVLALAGMNVASTLYLLAFAAGVPGLKRNRWEWFYLAVFLAAMIKITFLALLLLPLLVGKRQWIRCILWGAAVVGANLAERQLLPDLYAGYQLALKQGILLQQSYGYGVFGVLASYHHTSNPKVGAGPYVVSLAISAAVAIGMLLLRKRLEVQGIERLSGDGIWLALVVVTIILVNPRQMQYDVDIGLFAAFVLYVAALRVKRPLVLLTLLFVPSLVVPLVVMNPHLHGAYETLLVLGSFALGYIYMWKHARPQALIRKAI